MRNLAISLGLISSLILANLSYGSWAHIPLKQRLITADFVVAGKLIKIKSSFTRNNHNYSIGEIKVTEVLKGHKDTRSVDLAFAKTEKGMIMVEASIDYRTGQSGIWILTKDHEKDCYWANYPGTLMQNHEKNKLTKILQEIADMPWGEESNGMKLSLSEKEQIVPKAVPGQRVTVRKNNRNKGFTATVQLYAINTTDKNFLVSNYMGDRHVSLKVIDPDGKTVKVDLYQWLSLTRLQAISKINFATQISGQIKPVENFSGEFVIPNLTRKGKYKITASYTNNNDGKKLGLKDVWTGKVTSNTIEIDVK